MDSDATIAEKIKSATDLLKYGKSGPASDAASAYLIEQFRVQTAEPIVAVRKETIDEAVMHAIEIVKKINILTPDLISKRLENILIEVIRRDFK